MLDDIENDNHRGYIVDLHEHLDPSNVEEEISEKQIEYLECLYDLYCNYNEDAFADWEKD